MTTRFRVYVQAAGPQFRHILKEEMHSLLTSASPTVKPPSFTDAGNAGVEFTGTLRDIYLLSHGLRSADDMLVQLAKKDRIVSLNKFVQVLQAIPFHAFGERFAPYVGRKGFKSVTQRLEEEKKKAYAERFTLPANTRVLVDKSRLSPDRTALKYLANESIRRMLLLRKGQSVKPKKWVYEDETLRAKADAAREEAFQRSKKAPRLGVEEEIDSEHRSLEEESDAEGIDFLDETLYEPKNSFDTFDLPKRVVPNARTKIRDETKSSSAPKSEAEKFAERNEKNAQRGTLQSHQSSSGAVSTNVIPPRPFPNPVISGLTINLHKNHMTVSISASGQRSNMLFKRGWRNRIIETSMRESVAAAVLHSAYTDMSAMRPDSPLVKLGEPQFTRPIANALNTLANSITSLPRGFKVDDELRQQQITAASAAQANANTNTKAVSTAAVDDSINDNDYSLDMSDGDVEMMKTPEQKALDAAKAEKVKKGSKTHDALNGVTLKTKKEILAEQEALRSPLLHSRDSTSLSDVVAYTISSGITRSDPSIRLFDPFCGSGTLVIEGAHKFLGLPAPALPRSFAFENWPIHNEPEYNTLIQQWNTTYDSITESYMETFGALKRKNRITGEEEITLDNFPLFVGTDLRDKSIRAATHNARMAKVDYFTDFFQSDFEKVMNQAGDSWNQYLLNSHRNTPVSNAKKQHAKTATPLETLPGMAAVTEAVILDGDGLPMNYFENTELKASNIISFDALSRPTRVTSLHKQKQGVLSSATAAKNEKLPLRFPYLKGYTLFSNVPWGVSDAKSAIARDDRTEFGRGHVNTTQMESMDSLYLRFGRALYHNAHLFRDVFVLSAHAKFEKLTMIGAERAEKEAARLHKDPRAVQNALILSEGYSKPASTMRWKKVETFYNQGVKTHLLKLEL